MKTCDSKHTFSGFDLRAVDRHVKHNAGGVAYDHERAVIQLHSLIKRVTNTQHSKLHANYITQLHTCQLHGSSNRPQ